MRCAPIFMVALAVIGIVCFVSSCVPASMEETFASADKAVLLVQSSEDSYVGSIENQSGAQSSTYEQDGTQRAAPPLAGMVWISEHGKRFHARKECSGMINPSPVTVYTARKKGLEPCKICYDVE